MQSTGQASTHAVSLVPMQGSAITYAIEISPLNAPRIRLQGAIGSDRKRDILSAEQRPPGRNLHPMAFHMAWNAAKDSRTEIALIPYQSKLNQFATVYFTRSQNSLTGLKGVRGEL